ncbi:MAG: GNAT family N-acetyltransferase [Devosia sp.]|nr:GNAT family N-acetyltransferase [Devosia sp.]
MPPAAALAALSADLGDGLIANLATELALLDTPAGALPVSRNDGRTPTCYICCPSVAYLDYAQAELRHLSARPALRIALSALVGAARPLLALSGLDRQVQPNNWLLATNPVPALDEADLSRVTAGLVARYPDHAVVWRSLNAESDAATLVAFRAAGYQLLPARQVHLLDCRGPPPPLHRDDRRDRALLSAADYRPIGPAEIGTADYPRIAALYARLYLDRYTPLNPHYTARFIAAVHERGLIAFHGLRNDTGELDGVIGFFDRGEVMTAPIVGYDTALPAALGLYRRLMAIGLGRARERRLLFNMSAGAAGFKRNRGAVSALEFTAVYARHLPLRRRLAIAAIRGILETVGIPVLRRFAL